MTAYHNEAWRFGPGDDDAANRAADRAADLAHAAIEQTRDEDGSPNTIRAIVSFVTEWRVDLDAVDDGDRHAAIDLLYAWLTPEEVVAARAIVSQRKAWTPQMQALVASCATRYERGTPRRPIMSEDVEAGELLRSAA